MNGEAGESDSVGVSWRLGVGRASERRGGGPKVVSRATLPRCSILRSSHWVRSSALQPAALS